MLIFIQGIHKSGWRTGRNHKGDKKITKTRIRKKIHAVKIFQFIWYSTDLCHELVLSGKNNLMDPKINGNKYSFFEIDLIKCL